MVAVDGAGKAVANAFDVVEAAVVEADLLHTVVFGHS